MKRNAIRSVIILCFLALALTAAWLSVNSDLILCRPLLRVLAAACKLNLSFDKSFYGSDNYFTARELISLANLTTPLDKASEADLLSKEALRIGEKSCNPESKRLFSILTRRGYLALNTQESAAAMRRALKIAYRNPFSSDFDPQTIARAEESLACIYGWRGENDQELLHYQRALDWRQLERSSQEMLNERYQPDYGGEAYVLENLAQCYQDFGKVQKADSIAAEAEKLRKKTTEKLPVDYWMEKGDLALSKGVAPEAEKDFHKALESQTAGIYFELSRALTRTGIARSLLAQNKLSEAEKYARDSLSLGEKSWKGFYSARSRFILASILARQNRLSEAKQLLRQAEPVMAKQMPMHKETQEMYELYAKLLNDQKDNNGCLQMESRAESIRIQRQEHPIKRIAGALAAEQAFIVPYPKDVDILNKRIESLHKEIVDKEKLSKQNPDSLADRLIEEAELLTSRAAIEIKSDHPDTSDSDSVVRSDADAAAPESNVEAKTESNVDAKTESNADAKTDGKADADAEADDAEATDTDLMPQQDYELARSNYERAMTLLKKTPGQPRNFLRCLIGQAKCYVNFGESDKAEKVLRQALELSEQQTKDKLLRAQVLEYLAANNPQQFKTSLELKKYKYDLLKRSLAIYQQELGSGSSKVTDLLFRLANLAWYISDAKPSGKELLRQAYSSQSERFERDLTAFGPIHPQIIEDLDRAGPHYDSSSRTRVRTAILGLFFGENDRDFAEELKGLTSFDGQAFSPEANLAHWNCLFPLLLLLGGLLAFALVRLPLIRRAGESKPYHCLIALCVFYVIAILNLLFMPDRIGTELANAPLELDAKILKRALSSEENSADLESSVDTLGTLGSLSMRLGKYAEAESYFKRAEEICKRHAELPETCPIETHKSFAVLLRFLNRPAEAAELEKQAKKLEKSSKAEGQEK